MPTEDDIQLAEEVESALRALGIADVRTRKDPRLGPHVMALRSGQEESLSDGERAAAPEAGQND
ncbi:hypothetical protein [Jiella sp. M17.18]|uniref:hypothetical protein n=1 Tax=Jiella sp. M17.18 TaxID=3234247 RepID=UPI0034DE432E